MGGRSHQGDGRQSQGDQQGRQVHGGAGAAIRTGSIPGCRRRCKCESAASRADRRHGEIGHDDLGASGRDRAEPLLPALVAAVFDDKGDRLVRNVQALLSVLPMCDISLHGQVQGCEASMLVQTRQG